jgi:hypothetical protein
MAPVCLLRFNYISCAYSLQALKSLVDYDEDSDEEEKSEDQVESPAKRKKFDDT